MKKRFGIILAASLAALSLAGCGGSQTGTDTSATSAAGAESTQAEEGGQAAADDEAAEGQAEENNADAAGEASGELETIVVGASPAPHAEILKAAQEAMKAKGYNLEIREFTDYVLPNNALEAGDLDANYFQHLPYLEQFNEQNGTHLANAGAIHYEPFGIYAGKTADLAALPDGAKVAVPNDVTNEARALLLLEEQGLLTLKEGAGLTATKNDIVENPKNLDILEIEAAQIPRSLQDVDIAVINGNYAIAAGLKVSDALATETAESLAAVTYQNVVAVKEGNEEADGIKALIEVLKSDEIKEFMNETYQGAVVPVE